jgi:hypothetical protein
MHAFCITFHIYSNSEPNALHYSVFSQSAYCNLNTHLFFNEFLNELHIYTEWENLRMGIQQGPLSANKCTKHSASMCVTRKNCIFKRAKDTLD